MDNIGIISYGIYIPKNIITSKEISKDFNIPEDVVVNKQGFKKKHVSYESETPSDMAFYAAKSALEKAEMIGVNMSDIGSIIYVGSQWKDYNVWLLSTYLQEKLGLKQAYSFDLSAMCAGMVTGLYLAKSILLSDDHMKAVLLVGASKESYIVKTNDPNTSWMDDFADAGVAAVIAKDTKKNIILKSDFMTDGSLSDGALIITGGAKVPFYQNYCVDKKVYLESLIPKEDFKRKMENVSLKNFKNVIQNSIQKSALKNEDVKMIFLNHMKPSFHIELLKSLNMPSSKSIYLDEYGHSQSADQFIGLDIALNKGLFKEGYIVFAAAGTGYVWSSTVIKWG